MQRPVPEISEDPAPDPIAEIREAHRYGADLLRAYTALAVGALEAVASDLASFDRLKAVVDEGLPAVENALDQLITLAVRQRKNRVPCPVLAPAATLDGVTVSLIFLDELS